LVQKVTCLSHLYKLLQLQTIRWVRIFCSAHYTHVLTHTHTHPRLLLGLRGRLHGLVVACCTSCVWICGYIWRVFHLWLRFITFGGHSAQLAYHVHKSGCNTLIILGLSGSIVGQRPLYLSSYPGWAYMKGILSFSSPHYLWRSHCSFSLVYEQK